MSLSHKGFCDIRGTMGTARHGRAGTHDPSVAGSIPAGPTVTAQVSVLNPAESARQGSPIQKLLREVAWQPVPDRFPDLASAPVLARAGSSSTWFRPEEDAEVPHRTTTIARPVNNLHRRHCDALKLRRYFGDFTHDAIQAAATPAAAAPVLSRHERET